MLNRIFLIVLCAFLTSVMFAQVSPFPTSKFTWEGAFTGNRAVWAIDDTLKTYTNLNGIDVTVKMLDPHRKNTTTKNPSDYGDYTKSHSFFGRGSLSFQVTATKANQDVCLSFEFSKPILLNKFNIWDIDMLQSTPVDLSTFQDNLNIYGFNSAGRIKMDITPMSRVTTFDILDQNVKATFIPNTNGDVLHTDVSGAIIVSSTLPVDKFDICLSNGPEDDGLSNSHAVRISEFDFSEAYGTIAGTVIEDLTNQPLSGSLITLLDSDGKPVYNKSGDLMEVITGLDGTYSFPFLPLGRYVISQDNPEGYENVRDIDGANDNIINVDLTSSNFNALNQDFVEKLFSPLPVKLTNLKATWVGDLVCGVSWTTSSEVNNHYFEVLISKDGRDYKSAARSFSIGNHNQTHNYYVECENPFDGVSYVKLVQYDLDGKSSQLGVVSLRNAHEASFEIHPNPVSMLATLSYISSDDTPQTYQVLNANGTTVLTGTVRGNEKSYIDFSQLPSGIYYFQMHIGGKNVTRKVVKQ
ncbi:MAG TPA: T9SS type A sorting domain-containing protein [Saprospiraceae bacterium]|nr:T9SS type A sorting domain-containing protein [Saprospiraceae bacterium]